MLVYSSQLLLHYRDMAQQTISDRKTSLITRCNSSLTLCPKIVQMALTTVIFESADAQCEKREWASPHDLFVSDLCSSCRSEWQFKCERGAGAKTGAVSG